MDWLTCHSSSDSGTESTQERVESVKARLQEEGREARNLIAYSLPISNKKQVSSSVSTNSERSNKAVKGLQSKDVKKLSVEGHGFKKDKRQRSASAGRDPQASLRARHWGFLFRNLEQAVHEIYQTCEDDESTIECKEAILMLERYANDFQKLIDWFKIKWEYEHTPPPQRKTSLTWEIRTSSPGKLRTYKKNIQQDARRVLSFDSCSTAAGKSSNASPELKKDINNQNILKTNPDNPSIIIHSTDSLTNKNNGLDFRPKSKQKLSDDRIEEEVTNCTESESPQTNFNEKIIKESIPKILTPNKPLSLNVNLQPDLTKDSRLHESSEEFSTATKVTKEIFEAKITKEISQNKSSITSNKVTDVVSNSSSLNKQCIPTKDKDIAKVVLNKFESQSHETCKDRSKCPKLEVKKLSDVQHIKNNIVKPGPLVNMNKASEVRKAFNQNRTPQKPSCSNTWKSTLQPTEAKENFVKSQLSPRIGLTRSATTLEGSIWNSQSNFNKKVQERSLCCSSSIDKEKYTSSSSLASSTNTSSSVQSWADKVKGTTSEEKQEPVLSSSLQDEDGGWEIVKRGRRSHGGSSASLNNQTPPSSSGSLQSKMLISRNKHKNGSKFFQMKNRFCEPSSAVSLPSLNFQHEKSEMTLVANRRSLPSTEKKLPRQSTGSCINESKTSMSNEVRKSKSRDLGVEGSNKISSNEELRPKITNEIKKSTDKYAKNTPDIHSQCSSSISAKMSSSVDKCRKDASNICKRNASLLTTSKNDCDATSQNHTSLKSQSQANYLVGEGNISIHEDPSASQQSESVAEEIKNNESSLNLISSETVSPDSSVAVSISPSLCKSPVSEYDDESEIEDEQMRTNAAALESAVNEEMRLKKEIEETKRETIAVCAGIQEEDESGEKTEESVEIEINSDISSSTYSTPSMSWAEEMDFVEKGEASRQPGRVLQMHEKLSSPSRKLPISEKFRRHKEKLAKAQELRGKLIQAKTEKLKDLFRKIDEVNLDKERLLMEKRDLFEGKMERAEVKRKCHLQEIVNKAHDEENKAREIAFINGLEAQNKLHDIMQQHQSHESRLADRAEERFRKLEEKAAKEAAAQERRKALEAERQARMAELCEKRRRHCERIDRQLAERREELLEQAREKARDREERLSALQQAQLAKESELVKKIQQKQEETARRHEENIEQIRQKALESSIMKFSRGCDDAPKLLRYETKKLCTLCNSLIASEVYLLSHLRGKHHQEALNVLHKSNVTIEESQTYNIKFIVDAPSNIDDPQVTRDKERQKALKKRCRKIRNRMTSRSKEYLKTYQLPPCKETPFKMRMSKSLAHIGKLLTSQGLGPWPTSDVTTLDRHLLELLRLLENTNSREQTAFASLNGFSRLFPVLQLITANEEEDLPCVIPAKSLTFCARVFFAACKQSKSNCHYLLRSNMVGDMVDFLMRRFNLISSEMKDNLNNNSLNIQVTLPSDSTAAALMELTAEVLQVLSEPNLTEVEENVDQPLQDVVSYCVSMGVADKISSYFSHIQNPVDNDPPSSQIILSAMSFISSLAGTISGKSNFSDPTQLIGTFHVTDACGVVSLLYGLLLHQGSRSPSPPPDDFLSPSTVAISGVATTLLLNLAELDLNMFQSVLGSEGISLEFRHISSFLLWYCSHWTSEEILHNVIKLVGFFTVNNKENQMVIQSGESPSVLQKLCCLPWQYFSEPRLTSVLFPTLLACCLHNDDNMNILQQEMSFQVLEDFMKNNEAENQPLMQILNKTELLKSSN